MTTMPTDRQSWVEKLEKSVADLHKTEPDKQGEIYFLVMEDKHIGKIVGCAAVYAGVGLNRPFYSYKLSTLTTSSQKLDMTIYTRILHLVNDYTGATELGSLFLLPEYRRDGIGRFLSRSRLMLLADFKERFNELVFAEMRGWLDEHDRSPFWEHLGRKFFGLSYQRADFLSAVDGSQFISDLMPKYPVYLDLLPQEAQQVVGKANVNTEPALNILKKEGFRYTGYVDIFDAGPCVQTNIDQIKTINESQRVTLAQLSERESDLAGEPSYLISKAQLDDYRIVRAPARVLVNGGLMTSQETAALLDAEPGTRLRIVKV